MFAIGQKVICVNARHWPRIRAYVPAFPKRGGVYTVRAIVPKRQEGYDEDGLHLAEVVNPIQTKRDSTTFELAFRMSRFRPRTDIAVFRRLVESAEEEPTHLGDFIDGAGLLF
jgi:hypothetical protein